MSDESHSAAPSSAFEHAIDRRIRSLEGSRRFWKWAIGLGAPILSSAAFAMVIYLAAQIQTSSERAGETRATIDAVRKAIDVLDLDIRELRSKILKLSGVDDPAAVTLAVSP